MGSYIEEVAREAHTGQYADQCAIRSTGNHSSYAQAAGKRLAVLVAIGIQTNPIASHVAIYEARNLTGRVDGQARVVGGNRERAVAGLVVTDAINLDSLPRLDNEVLG